MLCKLYGKYRKRAYRIKKIVFFGRIMILQSMECVIDYRTTTSYLTQEAKLVTCIIIEGLKL